MKRSRPWYETFFDGLYADVLGRQFDPDRTRGQAAMVKRILRLRQGQRVLDCPCGMGRMTIALAQLGLEMTGVDLTERFLRRARRRARQAGVDVGFRRRDMREIDFAGEFHAVVNWFTSFGYFDEAGNLETARRALAALRPGGRFLIDVTNKSWVLARFARRREHDVGKVHIAESARYDAATGTMHNVWTLRKGARTERHGFRLRLYNGRDLRALLRKAGFGEVTLYGWRPLGRLTRHSRRLIAVARKPS